MVLQNNITEPTTIVRWSAALEELHGRIARRFSRVEVRERARRYLQGLLQRVERKNGWQLAEAIGEADPQGVQRLLNAATWDADAVRDDLRGYVVEHLGDEESGILIIDETGFPKKGDKSVGVAPQYTGTTGDTTNAQVGVFLAYVSGKGAAFIDRALYLPEAWTNDADRSRAAGIPGRVEFATKVELARQLLERAIDAGVPARWLVADSFYGRSHGFRHWLEQKGQAYALMIPKTNAVRYQGRRVRVERLAERVPGDAWVSVPAEGASFGRRPWEWACLELPLDEATGMRQWLVVRRSLDEPSDLAFYQAYGPQDTTIQKLVKICGSRWHIEECFAQAKGEVGLDQYEVRRWDAWHRYVTLCLLAHALLVVTRAAAQHEEARVKKGALDPALIPLTVPEVRRLVLAMAETAERRSLRLAWSQWSRAHQAGAARCRAARRAAGEEGVAGQRAATQVAVRAPADGNLTDAEWEQVRSVLPPQRPPTGRPRHDHRGVLGGILWVARTRSSWREMPEEFGKWETAYRRYRLWLAQGLWQRIATILGVQEPMPNGK